MIKNKLKELMEIHSVGAYQLAKKTGITYSNIYNMLNHAPKGIQYDTLTKLCKYFKCEVSDILEYSGD